MNNINNIKDLQEIVSNLENFKLNQEEGNIILSYLEGHDYEIRTDKRNLFVVDIQDGNDKSEEKLKDIINRVREWNYELIKDTENEINSLHVNLDQHLEYEKLMNYLTSLKNDENTLNGLYTILNK